MDKQKYFSKLRGNIGPDGQMLILEIEGENEYTHYHERLYGSDELNIDLTTLHVNLNSEQRAFLRSMPRMAENEKPQTWNQLEVVLKMIREEKLNMRETREKC